MFQASACTARRTCPASRRLCQIFDVAAGASRSQLQPPAATSWTRDELVENIDVDNDATNAPAVVEWNKIFRALSSFGRG